MNSLAVERVATSYTGYCEAMDDLDLMRVRAETLYTYAARGRMARSNELDGRPAPRVFLGYTLGGYVLRFGETTPDDLVSRLDDMVVRQPAVLDLRVPPAVLADIREELEQYAPISEEVSGPTYRFPESIAQMGEVVQLTDANIECVTDTFTWLLTELIDWWPCFAVVQDGAAVSICFSSRIGDHACEAGLDTKPAFRGRGYAAAVTAAWGASVRDSGRIPIYSTSWENLVSQAVARRLELSMFGADVTLR